MREDIPLSSELSALYQAYYALYAVCKMSGAAPEGQVAELMRATIESSAEFPEAEARSMMAEIVSNIERIDNGGKPVFAVIEGGKDE